MNMPEELSIRGLQKQPVLGFAALLLCFAASLILWPLWSIAAKAVFSALASSGLAAAEPVLSAKLVGAMVEGSFLWLILTPWIWIVIGFDCHGKTWFSEKQPWAGICYFLVAMAVGAVGFLVLVSFMGIWWRPFNLAVMLTPATASDVGLALTGWEVSNFYSLMIVVVQIAFATLLHKWPFGGTSNPLTENIGNFGTSTAATFIAWVAMIFPSFLVLSHSGEAITAPPFGSFPAFLAFLLGFVIFSIVPVMGAELFPVRPFAKKQPYMAVVGIFFGIAAGFALPPVIRTIVAPLNLLPGAPADIVVSSLELSVIIVILILNDLFDCYPSADLVPNTAMRILARVSIWIFGGFGLGILWIKTFPVLTIGGNNLGLGFPTMGVVAGQFAFLMTFLYFAGFFDRWPLVRRA
jgi:hypothetical protein